MPETNLNITEAELLEKLKNSYIDDMQKKELESLLPEMTNEERIKLVQLIGKADEEFTKTQVEYKEGLEGFHKELKETDEKFRKDFEAVGKKEETEDLKEFETEIQEMTGNSTNPKKTATPAHEAHKHHTLRNTILTLLGIALIAGGILYTLF